MCGFLNAKMVTSYVKIFALRRVHLLLLNDQVPRVI